MIETDYFFYHAHRRANRESTYGTVIDPKPEYTIKVKADGPWRLSLINTLRMRKRIKYNYENGWRLRFGRFSNDWGDE